VIVVARQRIDHPQHPRAGLGHLVGDRGRHARGCQEDGAETGRPQKAGDMPSPGAIHRGRHAIHSWAAAASFTAVFRQL
jgi:hypothetical protein